MKILSKTWLWVILSLLVLNLALTLFLFSQKNERQKFGIHLIETLNLSEEQIKLFEASKNAHFEKMSEIGSELRATKGSLFAEIGNSNKLNTERILSKIGKLETEKNRQVFNHFSDVRSFLDEEQQVSFDNLLQNSLTQGARPGIGNGGPPPRGAKGRAEQNNERRPPEGDMKGHRPPPPLDEEDCRPPPPRD